MALWSDGFCPVRAPGLQKCRITVGRVPSRGASGILEQHRFVCWLDTDIANGMMAADESKHQNSSKPRSNSAGFSLSSEVFRSYSRLHEHSQ